jgi:hypothetical protein
MPEYPKQMSRRDERRGTRRLLLGTVIAVIITCGAFFAWPYLTEPSLSTDETGPRSQQKEGVSVAGKTTQPPSNAQDNQTNAATIGRNDRIIATAKGDVDLKPEQARALKDYFSQHPDQRQQQADFSISIGAAVPRQEDLRDWPKQLADALPDYRNDQYVLVGNQVVVVEQQTRRIVAIIPVTS